jgi:hypothetical protein
MMAALRSLSWWIGVGLGCVALYAIVVASEWSLGGRLFPWFSGFLLLAAVAGHTVLGLARGVETDIEPEATDGGPVPRAWRLKVYGWLILLVVLVPLLGHLVAVPLFVFAFMTANGERLWLSAALAAATLAFLHFVLEGIVHVDLPRGLVTAWFG